MILSVFGLIVMIGPGAAGAEKSQPLAWWSYDGTGDEIMVDRISGSPATITGRYSQTRGVLGKALKLDGYTTEITGPADQAPTLGRSLAVESWVALGAYPWNWCPIISQCREREAGYDLSVGPGGQVRLRIAVGENWLTCTSEEFLVPLREWTHVAATYDPAEGLRLFVNGRPVGHTFAEGLPHWADDIELRIGSNHHPIKPSNIHREHGTLPLYFSLDGILDELKVYDQVLTPEQVSQAFQAHQPISKPDLPPRKMPAGPEGPGRFGAYYVNLKYYPEWDALWRVDADPDVLVRFDRSPVRVVFWRGSRYSPAWVIDDKWMADQSAEAWEHRGEDVEGCFEHMQDRRCRYSHVRVIESTPARAVVHWRYALVSAHNNLWNEDPKTGRACWIDEYYTIYPDALGIRKMSWKTGTFRPPRQLQESLPFTNPGQTIADVVEKDFATLANMDGESITISFVEDPAKEKPGVPEDLTIQVFNFRSPYKPSILYEPGSEIRGVRDYIVSRYERKAGANHWPVGQMACDGRSSVTNDRPTHFQSLPLTRPLLHEKDGRTWWNGLYGMTDLTLQQLAIVARSWNFPAELNIETQGFMSHGYDRGQRSYVLERTDAPPGSPLAIKLQAESASPLYHPVFIIRKWGSVSADVNVDGNQAENLDIRIGYRHYIDHSDLIIWCDLESDRPVQIEITPGKSAGGE